MEKPITIPLPPKIAVALEKDADANGRATCRQGAKIIIDHYSKKASK